MQLAVLSGAVTAFATTASITQLKFTSSTQSIATGATSATLTVQTQNASGTLEALSTSGTKLVLATSSATGEFSSNGTTGWVHSLSLTMSSGTANKNFYYRDTTAGAPTLTASAADVNGVAYPWTSATQSITISAPPLVDTTAPTIPVASVAAGTYAATQTVTLSASDGGSGVAGIYYTNDGSMPTTASTKYVMPISVATSQTITAMAIDNAGNQSAAASFVYTILPPPPVDVVKPTVTLSIPNTTNPLSYQVVAHDDRSLSAVAADVYRETQLIKSCSAQVSGGDYTLACTVPDGLADGAYTIRFYAIDAAENASDTHNEQFVISHSTSPGGGMGAGSGTTNTTNSGSAAVSPLPVMARLPARAVFATASPLTTVTAASSLPRAARALTTAPPEVAQSLSASSVSMVAAQSGETTNNKTAAAQQRSGASAKLAWYWWLLVGLVVAGVGRFAAWQRRRNRSG